MALTGGDICTAIITKGIGNLPACESIITSQLGVAGLCVTVIVTTPTVTGGSPPLAPGEIGNLYQPVDAPAGFEDHPAFYSPQNQADPFSVRQPVKIIFEFRGNKTEKDFVVSPRRAAMIVKVAELINKTSQKLSIKYAQFKKVISNSIKIRNLRKKR